jgi:hypothetical protein
MAVAFSEVEAYPKEVLDDNITGTRGSFTPIRRLRCAWSDRWSLVSQLWYTYYPYVSASYAVATKFTIEPFPKIQMSSSGDSTIASYAEALVTAFYTTDRFVSGAAYFTETLAPEDTYDWRTTHREVYFGATGGSGIGTPLDPNEAPVLAVPGLRYTITYYKLATIPSTWISMTGYVNSATFTTKALGVWFAKDCVRYDGCTLAHKMMHNGSIYYTATLSFLYRPNGGLGWQAMWRSQTASWEYVYNSTQQILLYPRGAFAF